MLKFIVTILLLIITGCYAPGPCGQADQNTLRERVITALLEPYQKARVKAHRDGFRRATEECERLRALNDCNCPAEPNWPKEILY